MPSSRPARDPLHARDPWHPKNLTGSYSFCNCDCYIRGVVMVATRLSRDVAGLHLFRLCLSLNMRDNIKSLLCVLAASTRVGHIPLPAGKNSAFSSATNPTPSLVRAENREISDRAPYPPQCKTPPFLT
jgi:hypothetical protein